MFAQDMQPYMAPNFGQGVSQFLTGQMGIPMQFGVDSPAYEPFKFSPGDFAAFMKAQGGGSSEAPMIPVFDPATGTYTAYKAPALPK
jgi:hypothetical protein